MQVKEELEAAADLLKKEQGSKVAISSGCELFIAHVMNVLNTDAGFAKTKRHLLDRLERFKKMTTIVRLEIANHTERFITDDSVNNRNIKTHNMYFVQNLIYHFFFRQFLFMDIQELC